MVPPHLLEQARQADAEEAARIRGEGHRRYAKPQIMKVPDSRIQMSKRGAGKPHGGLVRRCYLCNSVNHFARACPKRLLDKGKAPINPPRGPRDHYNDRGGTDGPIYNQDWSVDPDDYGHRTD
ncbi:hypothetical protein EW146_g8427 [Bondarzewia mesenterica]|uniref:CCHC-type domain-containing protein n=1 Tax=Bondarzewia mesenterica TaxID=1095465 RepID=A0A4S4LK05_9AGAM|nr:hypothetical protein EW146_g8427 [Bondarzewia mesenterica]